MSVDINLSAQYVNFSVTIGSGVLILFLLERRELERHVFYYGWAVGFIMYGLQILFRALGLSAYYFGTPMIIAFVLFPVATFSLNPRTDAIYFLPPVILVYAVLTILFYMGVLQFGETVWLIGSVFSYVPVAVLLVFHRKIFGDSVDKLVIGWISLLLVNLLLPMGGLVPDVLCIFSKIVILLGILNCDFAIVSQRVRRGLSSGTEPFDTGLWKEGGLDLVMFSSKPGSHLADVSSWIIRKTEENIKLNVETSIIVLQDILPYDVLRSAYWKKPELIHIFGFSQDPSRRQEFTNLRYGMAELGATVSEISKKQYEKERRGEIILVDLSILIHTFGPRQAYNFLLNKMGIIRSSGTRLTAVFHPQTHEEQAIALFKTAADRVIQN